MNQPQASAAQMRFDSSYISAFEIQQRLKIARCSITLAYQRGSLPRPVVVGAGTHIWEREEAEPFIRRWEVMLNAKRVQAAERTA